MNSERSGAVDIIEPTLQSARNIGEALREIREFRGLSLDDVSQTTRIRQSYLKAIEEMRLGDLPSRPFTIGYVRAYAEALSCDPEAAAGRFRRDAPEVDQTLREPVGVRRERDPRLTLFVIAGAVVVVGVALWNIAQHSIAAGESHAAPTEVAQSAAQAAIQAPAQSAARPAVSAAPAASAAPPGTLPLGAPLPAPPESTTPAPYVTPGLEAATGGAAASGAPADDAAADGASATPVPFVAQGAVYGVSAAQSTITLQASRPGTLVIHGADGTVYFAKELAAGEAYRVPQVEGLSVDVSDPLAFNVFVGGALKGPLPAAQAQVSKLTQ